MNKIAQLAIALFITGVVFAQESANNNTTICWDVSNSMIDRDLEKELSILDKVFQRNSNQQVQLLLFGIAVEERNYTVHNGNWNQLREDLKGLSYDGGTVYATLKERIKYPNVYVFTDGHRSLSKDIVPLKGKSFLINSSANRDATFLERTALLNKSRLMDFAAVLPENVKQRQKTTQAAEAIPRSIIKGTVYIDNKPTPDVKIAIKGFSDSFLTGPSGDFALPAQVGDTLVVTSRKSKTIRMLPVEAMVHMNVFMASNIVALEEVVVVEEELEKVEMALTGYGLQRKEAIGYTVSTIGDDEISEVTPTIDDAINTKVPGLDIRGKMEINGQRAGGLGSAKIRGNSSINMNTDVLVVVNGVPMQRSRNSSGADYTKTNVNMDYIDPTNIANITVLKGLAATNAWGSEGRGGVILITTKTAAFVDPKTGKPVDQALVKNNVYNESEAQLASGKNPTHEALERSGTLEDAYDTYLTLKAFNGGGVRFYLEAFDYFKSKDPEKAGRIISNVLETNPGNIEVLRVVSKAFSTIADHANVVRVNEELIDLAPNDVNAYLNRAKARVELGQFQKALNELLALDRGTTYFSVNASGISKTLKREIKNLITNHKSSLSLTNVPQEYLNNVRYKVRLLFEWNQPGAEFELQFVNPQKRFFNWEHTNSAIRNRIEDELKYNYRVEEYEFYGDVEGDWVINAKYLGDETDREKVPLVLKTTIYKNFGYPTQSQEAILVHFSQPNEKKNLKNLMVN